VAYTTVLAVTVISILLGVRSRFGDTWRYATLGGFAYALVCLSLWALIPAVFWRFAVDPSEAPIVLTGILVLGFVALALQGGVALYLYDRWELRVPLLGLFVSGWVCGYLFLRVGGESGSTFVLFLWGTTLAPVALSGIVILAGAEKGARCRGGWCQPSRVI